jgi:hypothetical protein
MRCRQRIQPLVIAAAILWTGCLSNFHEVHYFESSNRVTGAKNHYRLDVKGRSFFSSSRYIAGYYDERAVDLFFNQLKVGQSNTDMRPLFVDNQTTPGDNLRVAALSPTAGNGRFVMLFSSNASAVANTIGQFAENQIVADGITRLVNQERVRGLSAAETDMLVARQRAGAVSAELSALMGLLPAAGTTPDSAATVQGALRILESIARAKGNASGFATFAEAASWFNAQPRR